MYSSAVRHWTVRADAFFPYYPPDAQRKQTNRPCLDRLETPTEASGSLLVEIQDGSYLCSVWAVALIDQ